MRVGGRGKPLKMVVFLTFFGGVLRKPELIPGYPTHVLARTPDIFWGKHDFCIAWCLFTQPWVKICVSNFINNTFVVDRCVWCIASIKIFFDDVCLEKLHARRQRELFFDFYFFFLSLRFFFSFFFFRVCVCVKFFFIVRPTRICTTDRRCISFAIHRWILPLFWGRPGGRGSGAGGWKV